MIKLNLIAVKLNRANALLLKIKNYVSTKTRLLMYILFGLKILIQ